MLSAFGFVVAVLDALLDGGADIEEGANELVEWLRSQGAKSDNELKG